jgi:hypothetical protein
MTSPGLDGACVPVAVRSVITAQQGNPHANDRIEIIRLGNTARQKCHQADHGGTR